jgi:hypothetical protein
MKSRQVPLSSLGVPEDEPEDEPDAGSSSPSLIFTVCDCPTRSPRFSALSVDMKSMVISASLLSPSMTRAALMNIFVFGSGPTMRTFRFSRIAVMLLDCVGISLSSMGGSLGRSLSRRRG